MHMNVSSLSLAEIEAVTRFFEKRGDKVELDGEILRIQSVIVS